MICSQCDDVSTHCVYLESTFNWYSQVLDLSDGIGESWRIMSINTSTSTTTNTMSVYNSATLDTSTNSVPSLYANVLQLTSTVSSARAKAHK